MKTRDMLSNEGMKMLEIRSRLQDRNTHGYVGEFREGSAPVRDRLTRGLGLIDIWYHVDENDIPLYERRLKYAGPFRDGTAHVKDDKGYFHIFPDGSDVYEARFGLYEVEATAEALRQALNELKRDTYVVPQRRI